MKYKIISIFVLSALAGAPCCAAPCAGAAERDPAEIVYFAMEMGGKLVGYTETAIYPGEAPGDPIEVEETTFLLLKALGQDFDIHALMKRKVDPETGRTLYLESDITRGDQTMASTYVFEKNEVRITPEGGAARTVALDEDVIVDDSLAFPYLVRDFAEVRDFGDGKLKKETYTIFEITRGEAGDRTFTLEGRETVRLLDKDRDCLVFEVVDLALGISGRVWIDAATGRAVKSESSIGVNSYLTDSSIKVMIVRGDMDERIFADVDTAISDFQAITSMKIRAKIQTAGEWVTPESLNVKGQSFEGTVVDNLIDGVFEIEHQRYDGKGAPPFPYDFSDDGDDESLKEFLEPEDMIESDDIVLIKHALEICKGSKDCWEAACRLSAWVATEIAYEIPGGSARHTFDKRKGECGSHSRLLTALCRGAGIPARLVAGCMYVPMRGGSFGQHAWNEIYMGDAGWITVDSTVLENDFVDSGHIRLGTRAAFNPVEMEVLDFKAGALEMGREAAGMQAMVKVPYEVGKTYTFSYKYNGARIGTEKMTVASFDRNIADGVYTIADTIEIQTLKGSIEYKLTHECTPLSYNAKGTVQTTEYSIVCAFADGKVATKIVQGEQVVEKTVDLPAKEKIFLIGNNNVSLLAFLALTAPIEEGETRVFKAFHPSSMQVFPAQVTVKGRETITWAGSEVECRLLEFSLAGTPIRMWLDDEGFLLRETEQSGAFVMELVKDELVRDEEEE